MKKTSPPAHRASEYSRRMRSSVVIVSARDQLRRFVRVRSLQCAAQHQLQRSLLRHVVLIGDAVLQMVRLQHKHLLLQRLQ